jgi:hypothetical protein
MTEDSGAGGALRRTIPTVLAAIALVAAAMFLRGSAQPVYAGFAPVTLSGFVFHDYNGDGLYDPLNELGLDGFMVDLFNGDALVQTVFSDGGHYAFPGVGEGTFTVAEEPFANWITTTAPGTVTTSSGVDVGGLDFGNFSLGVLSGHVLEDLTGDGFSPDDTPLTTPVTVDIFLNGGAVPVDTRTTIYGGRYDFAGLGPGVYAVRERVPAGFVLTAEVGATTYGYSGFNSAGNDFDNLRLR